MDVTTFDLMTRLTTFEGSRHLTLRALGSAALAAVFGGARNGEAAACASPGKKCGKGKGRRCCPGGMCKSGRCRCRKRLTRCGAACRDLSRDRVNCGSCGNDCGAGNLCDGGQCIPG